MLAVVRIGTDVSRRKAKTDFASFLPQIITDFLIVAGRDNCPKWKVTALCQVPMRI